MTMLLMTLVMIAGSGILIITLSMSNIELGEKAGAVLPLLRIMLPYMVFICLVALSMGILNSFHHFTVPAFTPVLLNIIWISALCFALPYFGDTAAEQIYGIAWAVLVAGVLQLLLQIPVLLKFGYKPKLTFKWNDSRVKKVLILMAPVAIGMGVVQINVILDGILALYVGKWAPAALTYAERLIYLPLGIFATALGTVLLPTFSHLVTGEKHDEMRTTLSGAMKSLMLIMIPAAVGLIILAEPIVRLMFEHGKFGMSSTIYTMRAVWFYAPGLLFFSINKVFVPAFYAMQNTRTPVVTGISMVLLNLVLNIVFIFTWPTGYRHAGLAFATVLSSFVSALILGTILHHKLNGIQWSGIIYVMLKSLVAAFVMAIVLFSTRYFLDGYINKPDYVSVFVRIINVVVPMVTGLISYFAVAILLCPAEFKYILHHKR